MKIILILLISLAIVPEYTNGQTRKVILSGIIKDSKNKQPLPFVSITLKSAKDSAFVAGTISGDDGRFSMPDITTGTYLLFISNVGYQQKIVSVLVGELSSFLELGSIDLTQSNGMLGEVTVTGKQDAVSSKMDKKTFNLSENIGQSGGSVLEAMKTLPGITTDQNGKVLLRGNDRVLILLDGKQTSLTGLGSQNGLDNIPASAIEKVEILNNPSAKYDANGNAGIINIVFKKQKQEGFHGKAGLFGGLGALWVKKENYPSISEQYTATPKINPSLSLNYRRKKINLFLQADDLYTKTLNKNEFVDRFYDSGDTIRQQTKRNRTTNFLTLKAGADLFLDSKNTLTVSGLFGSEKILDRGDEPFFNWELSERLRLWQFLEDELKTTVIASANWEHKFVQPGRLLNTGFNYTFHREDEKYFFTNVLPTYTGLDSFKLISDEHVLDFNIDYIQPYRSGRIETGFKFRRRSIPVNMQFKPGINSPLDTTAGGRADYGEMIPAIYGNYVFESNNFELEAGLRIEYADIKYEVNPKHPVYKSDGYDYVQPFPNLRLVYKLNERNRFSFFYNRRVDRPNEVDIRIFPKYDDVEIIKVGNPALRPQFTNSFELGYKANWNHGYLFSSVYHKRMDATIIRIGSIVPGSPLIYNIFQNAGKSYSTGFEFVFSQNAGAWGVFNLNVNGYQNVIDSFTSVNKYPVPNVFHDEKRKIFSGSLKLNSSFHLPKQLDIQLSAVYQAPDLVPQGKTFSRFSIDLGIKKNIQKNRGELIFNVTDLANTLNYKKEVFGNGFHYISTDYYETQVFRLGYSYKF